LRNWTHNHAVADVETFGARVRRERLALQMTQRQLADQVNVGVPHISKVEADRESPSDGLIERLAEVFGVDVDELFIVARRLPESMVEKFAVDPAKAAAHLREWKAPKRR
jgi:transcriptional regulator with XRE-family HTH domain